MCIYQHVDVRDMTFVNACLIMYRVTPLIPAGSYYNQHGETSK